MIDTICRDIFEVTGTLFGVVLIVGFIWIGFKMIIKGEL